MNEYSIIIRVTPDSNSYKMDVSVSDASVQFVDVPAVLKKTAEFYYDTAAALLEQNPETMQQIKKQEFTWADFMNSTKNG